MDGGARGSHRTGWAGERTRGGGAQWGPGCSWQRPSGGSQTCPPGLRPVKSPLQAIDSCRFVTYGEELAVTLVVLICALGVAILTAAASAVAVWRVRNSADQRVADAVQKLAAGMRETMRDLAQAVETAQTSRADLHVGELAASLDLDEVTERTLEAASEIPGV